EAINVSAPTVVSSPIPSTAYLKAIDSLTPAQLRAAFGTSRVDAIDALGLSPKAERYMRAVRLADACAAGGELRLRAPATAAVRALAEPECAAPRAVDHGADTGPACRRRRRLRDGQMTLHRPSRVDTTAGPIRAPQRRPDRRRLLRRADRDLPRVCL